MPLSLQALMEKAKDKGISSPTDDDAKTSSSPEITRPWQQESVLFNEKNKKSIPEATTNRQHTNNSSEAGQKQISNKLTTNRQQTDNKPTTNRQQTGNKTDNKPTTNRQQTDNKPTTKITNRQQTDNKLATEPTTKLTTNRQQTGNKLATNLSFSTLVGLQRNLVIFIYQECKKARAKETRNLSLEYISNILKMPKGSVKTTLQRLETKGFINRTNFKVGRGGWSQYSIPDLTYQELMQIETDNKLATNWQQTGNKPTTQPATQPATIPPVVSSSYINTTTTNMPEEFRNIDYSVLAEIGFNETHIIQIYREYKNKPEIALSYEIIQDSINALAYDLKHNNAANAFKNPPAVVLTSMLKKGMPYASKTPDKFISPQEEAMKNYLEAKEKQQKIKLALEEKTRELEYQSWLSELPEDELLHFVSEDDFENVPDKVRKTLRRRKALELAKDYFAAEVWPKRKEEIISSTVVETEE